MARRRKNLTDQKLEEEKVIIFCLACSLANSTTDRHYQPSSQEANPQDARQGQGHWRCHTGGRRRSRPAAHAQHGAMGLQQGRYTISHTRHLDCRTPRPEFRAAGRDREHAAGQAEADRGAVSYKYSIDWMTGSYGPLFLSPGLRMLVIAVLCCTFWRTDSLFHSDASPSAPWSLPRI